MHFDIFLRVKKTPMKRDTLAKAHISIYLSSNKSTKKNLHYQDKDKIEGEQKRVLLLTLALLLTSIPEPPTLHQHQHQIRSDEVLGSGLVCLVVRCTWLAMACRGHRGRNWRRN